MTCIIENGNKVIAGWFNIPIQQTLTLELRYRLNKTANNTNFPLLKQIQTSDGYIHI
jgi:hypothetical protein